MEYLTIFKDLPTQIKALTIKNRDGGYTIILNSRLNYEQNRKSYLHELKHICNGDCDKCCDIDTIELKAHRR